MRLFAVLIDNGGDLASTADAPFPDMARAVKATIAAALVIAAEQAASPGSQMLLCEIQDQVSREQQRLSVSVVISPSE